MKFTKLVTKFPALKNFDKDAAQFEGNHEIGYGHMSLVARYYMTLVENVISSDVESLSETRALSHWIDEYSLADLKQLDMVVSGFFQTFIDHKNYYFYAGFFSFELNVHALIYKESLINLDYILNDDDISFTTSRLVRVIDYFVNLNNAKEQLGLSSVENVKNMNIELATFNDQLKNINSLDELKSLMHNKNVKDFLLSFINY